jgi:hypothetical protein
MAVTNFIPEIWAGALLSSLKKRSVFTQGTVVNRNYEGEIRQQGDTVRITSIGAIAVDDYTNHTDITVEEVDDATQSLLINQAKYFAFTIDDVEAAQSVNGGAVMQEAMTEAAYSLADVADLYVASLASGAAAGNQITTTAITTPALAVDGLIDLMTRLNQSDVPTEGRYVIVPPWYYALLLGSDLFVRADAAGSTDGLRNGIVGRAFGFDVLMSNNVTNTTGDDFRIVAGYPGAITFAEQIVQTEADRMELRFADLVKGLHVYGAKVVRPTGLATLIASQT